MLNGWSRCDVTRSPSGAAREPTQDDIGKREEAFSAAELSLSPAHPIFTIYSEGHEPMMERSTSFEKECVRIRDMNWHPEGAELTSNLCVEKMPAKEKENMEDVKEEGRLGVETLCAPLCIAALSPSSHCLPAPSSCDERQSTLHHHLRERWHEMEEGGRTSR